MVCTHTHTHTNIRVCVFLAEHTYTHIHACTRKHKFAQIYQPCARISKSIHTCMCVYKISMYVCIYTNKTYLDGHSRPKPCACMHTCM